MNKSRLQPIITCYAALLLVAQLVLTAGHLHLASLPGDGHPPVIAAKTAGSDAPGPGEPLHDEDHCPLCWGQTASGTTLVPPAIALPLPPVSAAPAPLAITHDPLPATQSLAFRPRAPPRPARA